MDQPMRNQGDHDPFIWLLAVQIAWFCWKLDPFSQTWQAVGFSWHCWRFQDVLVMSCMACHLGLPPPESTELRTECVIDVVQATSYLGTAVVFLYKARNANQTPNQSWKKLCFIGSIGGIFRKVRKNKKRARHVGFADARLRAFAVAWRVDHQNLWMPLWMPLSQQVYHTVSRVHPTPLMISDNGTGSMTRLNQPGRFTVTTF